MVLLRWLLRWCLQMYLAILAISDCPWPYNIFLKTRLTSITLLTYITMMLLHNCAVHSIFMSCGRNIGNMRVLSMVCVCLCARECCKCICPAMYASMCIYMYVGLCIHGRCVCVRVFVGNRVLCMLCMKPRRTRKSAWLSLEGPPRSGETVVLKILKR